MKDTIEIRILLFAGLAEQVGAREFSISLSRGASIQDALDVAGARYPSIASARHSIAVALNEVYARGSDVLNDGDALALIPPVSGG